MSIEARLSDLLEQQSTHRQGLGMAGTPASSAVASVWPGLLWAHRLRGGELAEPAMALRDGVVDLESPGSKAARAEIGTNGCVFCSVAVAPYWEPPVVMLFGPLEDERLAAGRLTAPWDTRGAAREGNTQDLTPAQLVARYSLPAPADQQYLPAHVDTCFSSLDGFLEGGRPVQVDAAGVFRRLVYEQPAGDQCWLHTPESRFSGGVQVPADTLRAVFVDEEALTKNNQRKTATVLRRLVEGSGGAYRSLQRQAGAVDYRTEVATFMKNWLQDEGWL